MKSKLFKYYMVLVVGLICTFIPKNVEAAFFSIDAFDSGWYTHTGIHQPSNTNYGVGNFFNIKHRNFFTFDLSSVTGNIVSAKLELERGGSIRKSGITDPFQYTLFHVETDIDTLINPVLPDISIYDDLGSGTSYGTYELPISPETISDIIHSFELNQDGINDIELAIGSKFAIGGDIFNPFLPEEGNDAIFGNTFSSSFKRLVLETSNNANEPVVPEPASMLLFGSGLAGALIRKKIIV